MRELPDKVQDALNAQGPVTVRGGETWAICPCHDDNSPSLRVKMGDNGGVLFYCDPCGPGNFANIIEALGLSEDDVMPERDDQQDVPQIVATYVYTDEQGNAVHRKLRFEPGFGGSRKSFIQEHWDGEQWVRGLPREQFKRYLYNFPAVLDAMARNEMVWIVEGEKDADKGIEKGLVTTTTTNGGKEAWTTSYSLYFRGGTVTIVADADEVGRERARRIAEDLTKPGIDATVRIVEAAQGKDLFDHFAAGRKVDEFLVTRPFPKRPPRDTWTVREYLDRPKVTTPWVIQDLLKRRERMMVIGGEGEGKSTVIRQMAIQTAAGIGPFSGISSDPKKVLIVDAENEHEDVVDSFAHMIGLSVRLGRPVPDDGLVIVEAMHKGGTKINTPSGRAWLRERVEAHQPDLITIGPLYKVVAGTLANDEVALSVTDALDSVRDVCGSALIIEHHPPLRASGDQAREIRAFGSSVLVRWPNFSFGLEADATEEAPVYHWSPTRGSRSRGRPWPERIRNGNPVANEWPWMPERPSEVDDRNVARIGRRNARAIS